jgi:hypothetical protein
MQIAFVALGLLTGVILVVLTEMVNRSFTNVDDIEKVLGLPVLGTIPPMGRALSHAKLEARKNVMLWILAAVGFALLLAGAMYFIAEKDAMVPLHVDAQVIEERMP